jgi:outer membrane lipoprotein-sorting protein
MPVARPSLESYSLRLLIAALLPPALSVQLAGCNQSAAPSAANPTAAGESADDHASLERAVEITTKMLEAYRHAHSYTDHATYVEESVYRGEGVAHELPYYEMTVALHRPNMLRLTFGEAVPDAAGAQSGFSIASDGESVSALLPELPDQMVEKPAPAKFTVDNVLVDPLIEDKLMGRLIGDLFPQLAMLLNESDEDEAAIFPHDSHPRLLPNATLDDHECYRVATTHPEGTRVLWIDAKNYWLRRMELPIEAELARVDPEHRYLRLSVRIDFRDITFDAEIEPASFGLAAPPGAHRVRRLVEPEEEGGTAKDAKDAKVGGETEEEMLGEEKQDE